MKTYKMTKIKPVLISATNEINNELTESLVKNFGFKIIDFNDPLITLSYDFFGSSIDVNQSSLDSRIPNTSDLELIGRLKAIGDKISKNFWIYKFARDNGLLFDRRQLTEPAAADLKNDKDPPTHGGVETGVRSSDDRIFDTGWEPVGVRRKIEVIKKLEINLESEFLSRRRMLTPELESSFDLKKLGDMIWESLFGKPGARDIRMDEMFFPVFSDYAVRIAGVVAFDLGEDGRGDAYDEIRDLLKTLNLSHETIKATTVDPNLGYTLCSAIRRRLSIEEYNQRQEKEFQPTIIRAVRTADQRDFIKLNKILTIAASSVQDGVDKALSSIGKKGKAVVTK